MKSRKKVDGEGRSWPFTIRISRRERALLKQQARCRQTSLAGIARIGLDPLFAKLAGKETGWNP